MITCARTTDNHEGQVPFFLLDITTAHSLMLLECKGLASPGLGPPSHACRPYRTAGRVLQPSLVYQG